MFKSAFFFALYGAIAGAGWYVYDTLDTKDEPLAEIKQNISGFTQKLTQQDSQGVYRWKNADGRWEYSDVKPEGIDAAPALPDVDYQKELAALKALPKNVLPVNADKMNIEEEGSLFDNFAFPGIPDMKQVGKLLNNVADMQVLHENRQAEIDKALENQR